MFKLLDQYGLPPAAFGELTYPQLIAIMTRGKPGELKAELWHARKVLADFKTGRLNWAS